MLFAAGLLRTSQRRRVPRLFKRWAVPTAFPTWLTHGAMWSRTWLRTNSEDTSLWNADDLDSLFIYKGPGFYELSTSPCPHPQQRFQLMLILLSSAPRRETQVESATEPPGKPGCSLPPGMPPSPSEFPVAAQTNCHNRMPSNSGVLSPYSLGGQKPLGHSQGAGRAAFLLEAQGCSLPFPASGGHPHSLAHAPSSGFSTRSGRPAFLAATLTHVYGFLWLHWTHLGPPGQSPDHEVS